MKDIAPSVWPPGQRIGWYFFSVCNDASFTSVSVGLNYLRHKGSTGITHSDLVLNIKKN